MQNNNRTIALAGNPNVGKSTVFNGLTGLHQHTGNWAGKTVSNARGHFATAQNQYTLVDIPGTYSLLAHSAEEQVARHFLCFGAVDATVVVCDATCLERNLNLVLQVMELHTPVVVCVNLLDEAKRKGISLDLPRLQAQLGVPVVGVVARKKRKLQALSRALDALSTPQPDRLAVRYPAPLEQAIALLTPALTQVLQGRLPARWVALKLLEQEASLLAEIHTFLQTDLTVHPAIASAYEQAQTILAQAGWDSKTFQDRVVASVVLTAEAVCLDVVQTTPLQHTLDRRVDRLLTSRWFGYPLMLLLLAGIFWLTITGANLPSALLADAFFAFQEVLTAWFAAWGAPDWLHGLLVLGMYRTLAWVVSVMLPPMAIFFPLFTLLEDVGYLPRVAYNLDKPFQRCKACGKQALTMSMGFGCNAAGIVGCRIIDSPRERLLAMLTNNFVPCNGRFPTLIAILTMFFVGGRGAGWAAGLLTLLVALGIGMTLLTTYLLSNTLLRGQASAFTLELPPYRKPQIGRVILRSLLDRTLFVLGRSIVVAAPAGLLLWIMANTMVGDASILHHCAQWLDPFGRFLGMDGVILLAFLLGLPANEIVLPIILMTYLAQGSLTDMESLSAMHTLLVQNGWTATTAICTMLFSLMHWPCSTTLLTLKKEAGGWKWVGVAIALPTLCGMGACALVNGLAQL